MSRNIRTLGDFQNNDNHDSGEESDDEQKFYVGGSQNSGQQVLGGPRDNRDMRDEIFQAARRAGAESLSSEAMNEQRSGPSGFSLGGMRLGHNSDSSNNADQQAGEASEQNNVVIIRMNMWQNGFSLDNGPLRDITSPENQLFINDIMNGRIPIELATAHPGKEIDLRMEKKSSSYAQPKSKPFEGVGSRLGGVVPNITTNDAPVATPKMSQKESEEALAAAQAEVKLDTSAPTTRLQIRLQSGQRIVGNFNHSHTVSAVRNFIVTAQPDLAFSLFQLMTTYPNKVIEDETLTLADCGLLNSVINVKPVAN